MKIAFITPSPVVLKHDWYRDLMYQKVGVPNLAGWLKRAGYPDIAQYDFNNQVRRIYEQTPDRVRLMLYADEKAVKRFLRSDDPRVRAQTEFFLDALKVKAHDIFALSLTGFLGDTREISLGARLAQCLAKALKERFPASVVVLGGLQNMSLPFQSGEYRRLLRECPAIDYAVCGEAHTALLGICRAVEKGKPLGADGAGGRVLEKIGGSVLVRESEKGVPPDVAYARYFKPLPDGETRDPSAPFGFPAYDKANSAAYSYTGARIRGFYHLPPPARPEKRGAPDNYLTLHVSFSEGCPFNCFFCSSARTELFCLDIGESIGILKTLKEELGCRHFLFYNPNFNPTYKYAHDFLERLIKADLDILWADCFNLRNMDRELIAMMREAGVIKAVTGVEYPTGRMLKYINKGVTLDRINRNLEDLHKAGIWNHVLLITGMPTETWTDVRGMEDWLKETREIVNSYTVGSFHMVEGSPFYRDPGKFGFRLKEAMQLYCQSAFDEKDGPAWRQKARQNRLSNEHIRRYIDELKGSRKPTAARMDDSHLLMYLYRTLGHDRKKTIEELYEAACTVNPHIAPAWAHLDGQLRRPASELNSLLRRAGIGLRLDGASRESLSFTLTRGRSAVSCSVLARSEDILINPAEDLFHGDFFVLRAGERAADAPQKAELAALTARLGARLTLEKGPAAGGGGTTVLLALREGYIRFILSPSSNPPSFRYEAFSKNIGAGLIDKLGKLLLKSASFRSGAPPPQKDLAAMKKHTPEILKIVEAWNRGPKPAAPGGREG